jgi:F-box interacting protein
VDAGSYQEEEPDGGRNMRLLDMDGNVVRVLKGVGGYGMMCNTSVDGLICVNGASCGGVNVVDPSTGKVLVSCPQMDVLEHGVFPDVALRYYATFGFGRAVPSGDYKLVRLGADHTCEVFTLGDGNGWRQVLQQSPSGICYKRGSPVVIKGVMYVFHFHVVKYETHDTLRCFDLESEQWTADVIQGPWKVVGDKMWRGTAAVRLTELNGALCMVQSVFGDVYSQAKQPDPITNIWILDDHDKTRWIKAYTVTMAPSACRYMPLWVMGDGEKLLLHCSFDKERDEEWSLVLQIYDRRTDTCTNIPGTPDDLAGRIGLCSFGFNHAVFPKSLMARFLDQALLYLTN